MKFITDKDSWEKDHSLAQDGCVSTIKPLGTNLQRYIDPKGSIFTSDRFLFFFNSTSYHRGCDLGAAVIPIAP